MQTEKEMRDALVARCRAAVNACEAKRMPATAKLLQEAAEALAAALRLREWRPIAEAPKDAPVLVTFAPGDIPERQMTMPGVMVAYWDAYYAPGGNGYDGAGDGWTDAHSGEGCYQHYGNPIAFAPLPAPPTADDLARVLEESATGDEAASG